jgi:hypothetical protein
VSRSNRQYTCIEEKHQVACCDGVLGQSSVIPPQASVSLSANCVSVALPAEQTQSRASGTFPSSVLSLMWMLFPE